MENKELMPFKKFIQRKGIVYNDETILIIRIIKFKQ